MTRRIAALAVLAGLVLMPASALAQEPRTSLPDIEDEVMCVSCNVALNIAESPQADRQRAFIKDLVDRGLTKEEVKDELVVEYGDNVLAMPGDDGFGLAAYLVPIAVVVGLMVLLAMLIPRWRRREPQPIATGSAQVSDAELDRLADDMKRSA